MISKGHTSREPPEDLSNIDQYVVVSLFLNIKKIPCLINSPIREDKHPSFVIYNINNEINYKDFGTGESGTIWTLLCKLWNCSYSEMSHNVIKNINNKTNIIKIKEATNYIKKNKSSHFELRCKIREWEEHDIKYWKSYGIPLEWLKYADVYPISHKIVIKNGIQYIYKADKYAYAYAEFKEGKTTLKIYQPYNVSGYKWSNCHDKSVISLWTKIPKNGDKVCICSSLKDALCLWVNTGIPAISIQGEGYGISITAINNLKDRYKNIYILLDNDAAGLKDAKILSEKTGFKNIVLPKINEAKDISDLYLSLQNKQQFKNILLSLFN